ncbi:glutamine-synthetase adenylyltransferase [Yoonia sp. I 8.24]|uniref:[protein-PII] uridylyltransferase family protein n=1 Tax=Yoonia sp. I 8.24 TaxID=1537229 RepID=UPI001EDE91EA|nr:glutamine-synthetase adenylyltransferase [Yoonia sp. I 8.24]MCG3266363.1 glutamine-synthetase adenylyltransferase [Yoonia sp. I 8.24]
MSFIDRLTRCPRPYDPDRGADALSHLTDLPADIAPLIVGTAGCSPYLAGLIEKEAGWIVPALEDPEAAVREILTQIPRVTLQDLTGHLRQCKRRIALITALADLGGVWPLETVTQVLTDFADASVQAALVQLVAAEVARGKLPGGDDPALAGGMFALAMGKMGAGELNYSSDIDLICLFDETRFDPDDYHAVRASFIRVTRKMAAMLSDVREGGYVFRTDLRLRPDASSTPVCLSAETAERYYESLGRTWERAAYIKARTCAGDNGAGARFLKALHPFVWRKHFDFAAIQDAHDMRLKIRDHKGLHGELALEGHNIKLGRGGIREIEFFTQTRQLIAGGRDDRLRVRGTKAGLTALVATGWLAEVDAETLYDDYKYHRDIEHRLQMVNDQQTHHLPSDVAGFERLAAFMDTEVAALRQEITRRCTEVHALTEGFFAPDAAPVVMDDWGGDVVAGWRNYPALRSARAVEIFERLKPEILAKLRDASKPDEALLQFDGFLAGLPAGVQLFSLFEANPQLTQLIVDIAATAPALAQYLSRNAGVFDAVIGGAFFNPWPGEAALQSELSAALAALDDYETQLITARRWAKEWHFRIGVHLLRGLITAEVAGSQYADLAGAVVAGLWPVIVSEFETKHGPMPGRGGVVLGMGSLGAGRLNAESDLDLIMIYDAQGVDMSEGRRPLATRAYYARLTQALVTALSAQMSEGRLYEVDMRLRPSGRAGPVATSFDSFKHYQTQEAWTWEHLALTRARAIAGNAELAGQIEEFRQEVLATKGQGATVLSDVADMRRRISETKPPQGAWDPKIGPGRLQDIELFAQMACLRAGAAARDLTGQVQAGVADGWLNAADAQALTGAAGLMWRVQAVARLLTGGPLRPDEIGEGAKRLILRETDCQDLDALADQMFVQARDADAVICRMLGGADDA